MHSSEYTQHDSDEEHTLRLDFGSPATCVARLPNCIFRIDRVSIAAVLSASGQKGAVWGDVFPRCSPFGPDVWDGEFPLLESFHRWAEPDNQKDLIGLKGMRGQDNLHMIIAASTPASVLERTYKESVTILLDRLGGWEPELDNVCRWIPELGWCCVLLDWAELNHAVLISSEARTDIVERFRKLLDAAGRATASVVVPPLGDQAYWIGPTVL
jgi:hypothetical protein